MISDSDYLKQMDNVLNISRYYNLGDPETYRRKYWEENREKYKIIFSTILEEIELFSEQKIPTVNDQSLSRRIFVVHGHDEHMKETVKNVLTQLEFKPVIL